MKFLSKNRWTRAWGLAWLTLCASYAQADHDLNHIFTRGVYAPPTQTAPIRQLNPEHIRVLQWNVHMFQNFKSLRGIILDRIKASDLLLVQEARHTDSSWRDRADHFLSLGAWHLAFAPYAMDNGKLDSLSLFWPFPEKLEGGFIQLDSHGDGIGTFSTVFPQSLQVKMSNNGDNIFLTYMPVLATLYRLEGRSEPLMVVHIHNLSSTGHGRQRELLDQAEALMAAHHGPLIFAGDFNSWTDNKLRNIERLANRQGLTKIQFDSPYQTIFGPRQLDHAFVRHMKLKSVEVLTETRSYSDHPGVFYELEAL